DPGAFEHLPDGRVREAGRAANKPRTPAGLAAAITDPLLKICCEQPRRVVRPTRPIEQSARLAAALKPAMPPAMRGRWRDAEGGRGRLQRETSLDRAHQRQTAGQSELGV